MLNENSCSSDASASNSEFDANVKETHILNIQPYKTLSLYQLSLLIVIQLIKDIWYRFNYGLEACQWNCLFIWCKVRISYNVEIKSTNKWLKDRNDIELVYFWNWQYSAMLLYACSLGLSVWCWLQKANNSLPNNSAIELIFICIQYILTNPTI